MQTPNLYSRPDIFEPSSKYTEDVRIKYGTQTIDIHQLNPHINVNLAEMVLPYSQIQSDQLVRYQITYFDFPSTNKTIYKGETVYLHAHVQFVNFDARQPSSDIIISEHTDSDPYNTIGIPIVFPCDMIANCEEMAQFMQKALIALQQQLCWQVIGNPSPVPVDLMQLQYALQNTSSYIFDSATSKFGFIFAPDSSATDFIQPLYNDSQIVYNLDTYRIANVDYYLRIDPTLSKVRQFQLMKMFGGLTTVSTLVPVQINGQTVYEIIYAGMQHGLTTGIYTKADFTQFWQNPWIIGQISDTLAYHDAHPTSLVPFQIVLNSLNAIRTFLQYSPCVSSILQSDYVYVRTNANSSNWNVSEGRKDDNLAVLPWTRAYGDSASFINHIETVDFASVENINAVKTVQLTLTDEFGEPLVFDTHFTLKIAVTPIA